MTLRARVSGQGPSLVLLHGWLFPSDVWEPLAAELEQHFRVHCLDLPGYGDNVDYPCDPYDIEQLVAALSPAVPQDSILIGWSLGALIALHWSRVRPEQLRGLILIGATPRFTSAPDWPFGTAPAQLTAFAESYQSDMAGTVKRFISSQTKGIPQPNSVMRFLSRTLANNPLPSAAALAGGLRLLAQVDYRDEVGNIALPTLVIHGSEDSVIPVQAGEALAQHIPQARWECFADSGHVPFVVKPRAVAGVIQEFCNELE